MLSRTNTALRALFVLVFAMILAANCSPGDVVQPDDSSTTDAASGGVESDTPSTEIDASEEVEPEPTATPTLADQNLASIDNLQAGEQVQDEQGNLLAVYGFSAWSEPFENLSDQAQAAFPFFGDIDELADPAVKLVALDVGMCSAGIDVTGFGTAEFFVHGSPNEVLSTDPVLNRGVLARHPVRQPGFDFPRSAECVRGWLPVVWNGTEAPATARYVLTTRSSADAQVERHVYQWELGATGAADATLAAETFGIGQTVTFNAGPLEATTVDVDGWAELVGAQSAVEGTRLVGVALNFCPASDRLPEFGLAVDGWNLIAVDAASELVGARTVDDPSGQCFDGWLEFVVPYGAVPTGFFVSDGRNASSGYAEWSLAEAALPTPQ